MIKYLSNHWNLEICDESRASKVTYFYNSTDNKTMFIHRLFSVPTQLNNQITTILSDLGVRDEVFFHFQQRWFQSPTQAPTSKM